MHALAKKNEERQGELEYSWAQRQASLAEREEELARLTAHDHNGEWSLRIRSDAV